MTTIAYDGNILAADSLISGGETEWNECKIWSTIWEKGNHKGISVFAGAGALTEQNKFKRWVIDGMPNEKPTIKEPIAILEIWVRHDCLKKEIYRWDEELSVIMLPSALTAIGSGSHYAIGAMEANRNAFQSVAIAMKHDCQTGGLIDYVKIDDNIINIIDEGVDKYILEITKEDALKV